MRLIRNEENFEARIIGSGGEVPATTRFSIPQCWQLLLAIFLLIPACTDRSTTQPLRQRAYVWQRQWTPAVRDAVRLTSNRLDGLVTLGAEFAWKGTTAFPIRTNIDWSALQQRGKCGIAIRVGPAPDSQLIDNLDIEQVASELRRLLSQAETHHVAVSELQLDFDCPVKRLATYSRWIGTVRKSVRPLPVVITALPAWLDSPAFVELIGNCDSYVLQVHSIPLQSSQADWKVCDSALARKWVLRAAACKKPFAVALPTYRCVAGYAPSGELLGVIMDSVQGRWPPDTTLRELATDPDEMADLVREWKKDRPAELSEIIWYRLPVETDVRNWKFATFAAVTNGRRPHRQIDVVSEGTNPVDVAIRNAGEADEQLQMKVIVDSEQSAIDADALSGCRVSVQGNQSFFATEGSALRLRPGERHSLGWLRFASPTKTRFQIVRQP